MITQQSLFGLPTLVASRRRGDVIKEAQGSDPTKRGSDPRPTTNIPAPAISGTEGAKHPNSEQSKATNQHRGTSEPHRSTISYQQAKWLGWKIEARNGPLITKYKPKRNWFNFEKH